jgi:hypothetical protein
VPTFQTTIISYADEPALGGVVAAALRCGPVVLLTDDRDAIAARPGLTVIEPEELIPDGASAVGSHWDDAIRQWLESVYPAHRTALLSVNLQLQPELNERILGASVAQRFFERYAPSAVIVVGPRTPIAFQTIPAEARNRGIRVREPRRARIERLLHSPKGVLLAAALIVRHTARFLRRVSRRRDERNAAPPSSGPAPSIWVALSPKWYQSSRHVIESILEPLNRKSVPYGLLFTMTYGERPDPRERNATPRALVDGTIAQLRPVAMDQVSGVDDWRGVVRVLARWLGETTVACARAIDGADRLRVNGLAASSLSDLRPLLNVATNDLLRIVDAEEAARRFLSRWPNPKVVVFSYACSGDVKVVDLALQRAGATTVDYAHGSAYEVNLRTQWPSRSTIHVSWTRHEATQFAALGTNRLCIGGMMPRLSVARPRRDGIRRPPRVLVATNYIHRYWQIHGRIPTVKLARRLAAAIERLHEVVGDTVEIVLRPHPHEERDVWRRLFRQWSPPLSDRRTLADDLADADILVATKSSGVVEAWAAGLPVFLHRGHPVEPTSLFGLVPEERWFATGDELAEKIIRTLHTPDLSIESRLLDACFGPTHRPSPVLPLIEALIADPLRLDFTLDETETTNDSATTWGG